MRYKIIKIVICILVCLVCFWNNKIYTQIKPNDHNVDEEKNAVKVLKRYIELRLGNADWKEYSKFITWPDEPSWDCNWVASSYNIEPAKRDGEKIVIPVIYRRIGLFCYNFEFDPGKKIVTINYELEKRQNGWMVNAPIPDYPDINIDILIKSLLALAKNVNETPERREKAESIVRRISDYTIP